MSTHPTILVFGSTGSIGKEVAAALAKKNVPFRAAVHKIEKADEVKKLGNNIEVVEVDIKNAESLDKALKGIEKVFFMTPPLATLYGEGMADALKRNGVKYAVKLSALGSEETGGKFIWAEEHRQVEDYIKKLGIHLTSIRPSSFFSNLWHDIPTVKNQSALFKALGDSKMNHIDTKDIGEVCAVCLTQSGHEGKIYNITGPDTLSWNELAKIYSEELGKTVNYVPITDEQLREQAKKYFPEHAIDGYSNMFTYFRNGGYDRHYDDGEKVLGRPLNHVRPFIREIKHAFA